MSDVRQLAIKLFEANGITIPDNKIASLDKFLQEEENARAVRIIIENLDKLMAKWKVDDSIAKVMDQSVRILNATVGKPYEAKFDFKKFDWKDIVAFEFVGLEELGLHYDDKTKQITGVPTQSGDFKIVFKFKIDGQTEDAPFNEKVIPFIVNPDPKSLWKNVESNQSDPHRKDDNVTIFSPLGDRHILASSKRGRSHANVGSFREDDFAFKELENGWSIVVVADGAGSAKLSRKGSQLACSSVMEYFTQKDSVESMAGFDELLEQYNTNTGDDIQKKLNHFVYNNLGKAVFQVHKKLEAFASSEGVPLKDLNSTLIFTLFKKYPAGYALLSFGVGDCPIAVLNKEVSEVTLMNWLDVGEFGGGTRFITMPEIFKNEKFATRFGFKFIDDFSYLIMMTDGIYDPKFVVEANLPNIKKWKEFLADLAGKNEDGIKVDLRADNKEIEQQFSNWMDFWSTGNHDDRTLVIVF